VPVFVGRLGSERRVVDGLGYGPRVVGRLGLEVRVGASFKAVYSGPLSRLIGIVL